MSVQMTLPTSGSVHCVHLADGKLIQLTGRLGADELPALRLALLTPLFEDCRDVVLDAGEVEYVEDQAVAVIIAAKEWATYSGARLLLSRSTPAFDEALAALDLLDEIPRLGKPAQAAPRPVLVPVPRGDLD